jgi:hypothetical protein
MLHFETINSPTLELLKQFQKLPVFKELRLVGGTSLALQTGHRKSIDLDFFGYFDADEFEVNEEIRSLGEIRLIQKSKNIFVYLINGVKTDIVRYNYEWLEDALIVDGLKLAGKKDIAAMKLAAITGRGTKKDFIDLAFLLQEFSLKQMLDFYAQKYPDGAEFLVLKSLGYFADADIEPMPVMLRDWDWNQVKANIQMNLDDYLDILP